MSAAFLDIIARDPPKSVQHTRGMSIGLTLDALAGLASAIASVVVLVLIIRRIYVDGWISWTALHVSLIALFFAELIMGIGHAMDLKWIIAGKAYTGSFCSAQGLIRQMGGVYAALSTLVIAIQTFLTIWWLRYLNRKISVYVNILTFIFIILWVGIGYGIHTDPEEQQYYIVPTPYWCWIGTEFPAERLAGEYVWFWTTLIISFILYIPLYLLHRGIIQPGKKWYMPRAELKSVREASGINDDEYATTERGSISYQSSYVVPSSMEYVQRDRRLWSTILYPVIYCIVILPLTVVRWNSFRTGKSNPYATFSVVVLFTLSGVFNALLYILTRTRMFQPRKKRQPRAPPIKRTAPSEIGTSVNPYPSVDLPGYA